MAGQVEPRITLAELGVEAHELNGLRSKLGPDWKGEASLSLTDAAEWQRKRQEATTAHEAAWRAHQAANEAWLAERTAVGRAAARAALDGKRPSPSANAASQTAWLEAAYRWQSKHPRPEWNGSPTLPDGLLIAEEDVGGIYASDDGPQWVEVS